VHFTYHPLELAYPFCLHWPIFESGQVIALISLPCGLGPISHIYPTDGDMQKIWPHTHTAISESEITVSGP